jgi:hypothetical protein
MNMLSPSLLRKVLLIFLFAMVLVLVSACASSQPKYSGDVSAYRFYVLQVRQVDKVLQDTKERTPQPGFIFLAVDLAVENISTTPIDLEVTNTQLTGHTQSGEYNYSEVGVFSGLSNLVGAAPPGFRTKMTRTYEVAANVNDLQLTVHVRSGSFWGDPSTKIALPPLGQTQVVEFPFDRSKGYNLTKVGQSIPWFEKMTVLLEKMERTKSGLSFQIKFNNTTGYALTPSFPFIYWGVVILCSDGSNIFGTRTDVVKALNDFSIPPGQSGSVIYTVNLAPPSDLKGAVLYLGMRVYTNGIYNPDYKWVVIDLSDVR